MTGTETFFTKPQRVSLRATGQQDAGQMALSADGMLLQLARRELALVEGRDVSDVVIERIYQSNTWTAIATHAVFRIGVTVALDPRREVFFWRIGSRCGAKTPALLSCGTFEKHPYMVMSRVQGTRPETVPLEAGRFLRLLHECPPDGFGPRGNWPPRRDHRFSTAIAYLEQHWPERRDLIPLIRLASDQFSNEKNRPNHGDFRADNMITHAELGFGLVDWTDAHLGSREEDLGGCDPEMICSLVTAYQGGDQTALSMEKIAGHSCARVLSLMAAGALTAEHFTPTENAISKLL